MDPTYNDVYLTTSGMHKMSMDKRNVGIDNGHGDKETYPYYGKRQTLQCRASKFNVNVLHREIDNRVKVESFQNITINRAAARMKKSIEMIETGRMRDLQLYLQNEGTIEMMAQYRVAGSVEAFIDSQRPLLEKSLDAARIVSLHKASLLDLAEGKMVSNMQGSSTEIHDGDENGMLTKIHDNAQGSWDRIDNYNRSTAPSLAPNTTGA